MKYKNIGNVPIIFNIPSMGRIFEVKAGETKEIPAQVYHIPNLVEVKNV